MSFQREILTQEKLDEALPLLHAHWKEVAHYKDIPLNPSRNFYIELEKMGSLRVYTARLEGVLIGYGVFIVRLNPHYTTSLQAVQDILYMDPNHRIAGLQFIKWCDEQLKAEGVQAVYHHVKKSHNFGPALERMGYELVDFIYGRRLDR